MCLERKNQKKFPRPPKNKWFFRGVGKGGGSLKGIHCAGAAPFGFSSLREGHFISTFSEYFTLKITIHREFFENSNFLTSSLYACSRIYPSIPILFMRHTHSQYHAEQLLYLRFSLSMPGFYLISSPIFFLVVVGETLFLTGNDRLTWYKIAEMSLFHTSLSIKHRFNTFKKIRFFFIFLQKYWKKWTENCKNEHFPYFSFNITPF